MTVDRRIVPEILKALAFAFATIGFITNVSGKYPFGRTLSAFIVGVIILSYIAITIWGEKRSRAHYEFEIDSDDETKFFRDWYSQKGVLKMFCTDVIWLEGKHGIITALLKKGDYLRLYLRYPKHEIVDVLLHAGAHIYKVKDSIVMHHRFSILNDDGIKSIIIRNKESEARSKVEIEEYRNHSAFYNLADDMLDDCYVEEYHCTTHQQIP